MMFKAYKRALDGLFIDEIIHIHSFGLCSKGKRDLGLSESHVTVIQWPPRRVGPL